MENNKNDRTIDNIGSGQKKENSNSSAGWPAKFFSWFIVSFGAAGTEPDQSDYYVNKKRKIADFFIGLALWFLVWPFFYIEIDLFRAIGVALIIALPFISFFTVGKTRKYIWRGIIAPYVLIFILWALIFGLCTLSVTINGPPLF